MFTANKRIVRNGHLICFEGETMTDEEAAYRGLHALPVDETEVEPQDMTVAELREHLEERGIKAPRGAKKKDLLALLNPTEDDDLYEDD